MRRLILFRHAKAEASPGRKDFDRPLTPRGRIDATLMARAAAERGLAPDVVLLSPSLRTRETWDCARFAFLETRVELRAGLYDATAEEIMAEVETVDGAPDSVMVIGHNPGLQEVAVNLLIDGGAPPSDVERVSARFPTATVANFLIDRKGRAALADLCHPRDIARGNE